MSDPTAEPISNTPVTPFQMVGEDAEVCTDGVCAWPGATSSDSIQD